MARRIAIILIAASLLCGCSKERMPYLGHWLGGFEVTSSSARAPDKALAMNGYLQLYRVHEKFIIQISNPTQVLTVGGVWRIVGDRRIELTSNSFRLDETDLDKLKAMRRPYIEPADLKAAYGKPMILDLKPDGTLTGLLLRVGPLLGKHVFRKGG